MTLPISIEHARELARLVEHPARPELVVIGAVALGHHLPLQRTTADVDIALVVTPGDTEALLTSLGWRRDERIAQRWYGAAEFRADVLPATRELIELGSVTLDDDHKTMSLVGFDLAIAHAVDAGLPGTDTRVKVASLPAIVVLKIVGWLDRPYERAKDLGDLARVLTNVLDDDDDLRWESSHPVGGSGLHFEEQSPFFAGLHVGAIVRDAHRARIDEFIGAILARSRTAAAMMARAANMRGEDVDERVQRLVAAFALGLRHASEAR